MKTGFAIDPITGESENSIIEATRDSSVSPHVAFLGSDDASLRDTPDADPREPIPHAEVAPISTVDSGAIDAVAVAPLTGEALASQRAAEDLSPFSGVVVDHTLPAGSAPGDACLPKPTEELVDYTVREADGAGEAGRPAVFRELSDMGTISDLHVPGEYPKRN